MRYELDIYGYVLHTYFGCYSGTGRCQEYTGEVPIGYINLVEWSEKALINAYYINNGNLTLDREREAELQAKAMQESIDYTPLFKKDLEVSNETLEKQYVSAIANGDMIILDNVKRLDPFVRITDIDCYKDNKVDIYVQAKNLLKNDGKTETINGIDFTKRVDGSININGTATDDIEYNLSGSSENSTSIFVLKKNRDYYLNIGGYECEMKYFDGETLSQVYVGASGLINLTENKRVTQVLLKIPSGTTVNNVTIRPQLEYGSSATDYEGYKANILSIDLSEYMPELIYPSETLYPSATLYPVARTVIDYIEVSQGIVTISVNGARHKYDTGNVRLFDGFNIIQTLQDAHTEITYYTNVLKSEDDIVRLESKITQTADEIRLETSKSYATKGELNTAKSEIKVTTDGISSEVSKKVGNNEIISKINQSAEAVTISANKFNINGTVSANGNFKVDTNGNMQCNNATMNNASVIGGKMQITGGVRENPNFIVYNESNKMEVLPNAIYGVGNSPTFSLNGTESGSALLYVEDGAGGLTLGGSTSNGITMRALGGENTYIHCFGNMQAYAYNYFSLKELKKNIKKYNNNALDLIKNSELYEFNYKDEEDNTKKHIGFIIGENYKTPLEVISENKTSIDSYTMLSICWKAIQEQQAEIESLKEEINKLKEGK